MKLPHKEAPDTAGLFQRRAHSENHITLILIIMCNNVCVSLHVDEWVCMHAVKNIKMKHCGGKKFKSWTSLNKYAY